VFKYTHSHNTSSPLPTYKFVVDTKDSCLSKYLVKELSSKLLRFSVATQSLSLLTKQEKMSLCWPQRKTGS